MKSPAWLSRSRSSRHGRNTVVMPTIDVLEARQLLSVVPLVPQYPLIAFDSTGVLTYQAATGALDVAATPLTFRMDSSSLPGVVASGAGNFQIHIQVDPSTSAVTGVAGDDLTVVGSIDVDGDDVVDYTGTLLTGEIEYMGYQDSGAGGLVDTFEFAFSVSGGTMAELYAGKDLVVTMSSENSTFAGSFEEDFGGHAKGTLGGGTPIYTLPSGIDIEKYVKTVCGCGLEGLTPGYWKQCQHFGDWTGYKTCQTYDSAFGVDSPGNMTLLQALGVGGGGVYAFMRQSAAALLNAENPNINYAFSAPQVMAMVQQAFATGDFEDMKNLFEQENSREADLSSGCSPSTVTPSCCPTPQPPPCPTGYGDDADTPTGPIITVGGKVQFTYVVTNTGSTPLANVTVTDDNATPNDPTDDFNPEPITQANGHNIGDTNSDGLLQPGETWLYTWQDTVTAGQHTNIGTAVGTPVNEFGYAIGADVTDSDPANWFGKSTCTKQTGSLSGYVYLDCDKDGKKDCGEYGLSLVKITLTGKDIYGNSVTKVTYTDCRGFYQFTELVAGTYTITETQPTGYLDGKDSLGTLGGTLGNDVLSNIHLAAGAKGLNYNFAELKKCGCGGQKPPTCGWDWDHKWDYKCDWGSFWKGCGGGSNGGCGGWSYGGGCH